MQTASVSRPAGSALSRALNGELAGQLRAAAIAGDEARTARLLSELLRFPGLPKAQRVPLQFKALLSLVQSLQAVVLSDDLTGLYNRRGFMQAGTRLLDVAARDGLRAWLVCLDIEQLGRINETQGRDAGDMLIRMTGTFMRDLFPSYGVYEVLGRLRSDEFAALTTSSAHTSSAAILLRMRPASPATVLPALSLSVGVAQFDPQRPIGIDELLDLARADLEDRKPNSHNASPELPPSRLDALTASGTAQVRL